MTIFDAHAGEILKVSAGPATDLTSMVAVRKVVVAASSAVDAADEPALGFDTCHIDLETEDRLDTAERSSERCPAREHFSWRHAE